jgi:hypothetical protein
MPEQPQAEEPYAIQYTESGRASRKSFSPEILAVLLDVLDALAANPDSFPSRTRALSLDGRVRLYSHPSPALQVTFEVDRDRRVLYVLHFVVPKVQVTKPVFISYSHKDTVWLKKLRRFLQPLEDREMIKVFDDTEIKTGTDWLTDIRKALESARVAVFLVTQDFLISPFIREQEVPVLLKAAHDRGCLIFWIAVSASTFEDTPLARIQGANPPHRPLDGLPKAKQEEVLLDIYRKMKEAVALE